MENHDYINGFRIYCFNSTVDFLEYLKDKKVILVAMNAEKILNNNVELKKLINNNLGYPDGSGAVMALRKKGHTVVKIAGASFWLDIIRENSSDKSFYLIGSTNEVIQKTVDKLYVDFPSLRIVGFRNGYLNEEDEEILISDIHYKKPDVIFVAQGSPRQEFLMNRLFQKYNALYMGLGGSFDVYCGVKKRAPAFFINNNLEWLYRLMKEPTRVGRQLKLLEFYSKYMFNKL